MENEDTTATPGAPAYPQYTGITRVLFTRLLKNGTPEEIAKFIQDQADKKATEEAAAKKAAPAVKRTFGASDMIPDALRNKSKKPKTANNEILQAKLKEDLAAPSVPGAARAAANFSYARFVQEKGGAPTPEEDARILEEQNRRDRQKRQLEKEKWRFEKEHNWHPDNPYQFDHPTSLAGYYASGAFQIHSQRDSERYATTWTPREELNSNPSSTPTPPPGPGEPTIHPSRIALIESARAESPEAMPPHGVLETTELTAQNIGGDGQRVQVSDARAAARRSSSQMSGASQSTGASQMSGVTISAAAAAAAAAVSQFPPLSGPIGASFPPASHSPFGPPGSSDPTPPPPPFGSPGSAYTPPPPPGSPPPPPPPSPPPPETAPKRPTLVYEGAPVHYNHPPPAASKSPTLVYESGPVYNQPPPAAKKTPTLVYESGPVYNQPPPAAKKTPTLVYEGAPVRYNHPPPAAEQTPTAKNAAAKNGRNTAKKLAKGKARGKAKGDQAPPAPEAPKFSIAARMLAKNPLREGEGLGANNQGRKTALFQNMSEVNLSTGDGNKKVKIHVARFHNEHSRVVAIDGCLKGVDLEADARRTDGGVQQEIGIAFEELFGTIEQMRQYKSVFYLKFEDYDMAAKCRAAIDAGYKWNAHELRCDLYPQSKFDKNLLQSPFLDMET